MKASNKKLLIKFRSKEIQFGVTRTTVKAIAKELDVNETQLLDTSEDNGFLPNEKYLDLFVINCKFFNTMT